MLVVVVVFTSLKVFTFPVFAIGTPPWLLRSVKASTSSALYPGYFRLLYFATFFRHSFIASATILSGRFLPTGVFYLTLLHPHFWHVFVTQMTAGTPLPGSSSVPAFTELSLPTDAWTWTTHTVVARPLIYQLRQWATKCRVKIKLLNIFCLFKVYVKTIKIHFD